MASKLGEQYAAIFSAHLQMLRDAQLRREVETMVRDRQYSPEYAVSCALGRYIKVFQSLPNTPMAERANDIIDIEKRILRHLLGGQREELSHLAAPVIVLAPNLTPSETAHLSREFVRGFATESGGPGSHTAIVAQALEIPAVVGVGPFLTEVSGGDQVIIDGDTGMVVLQPDAETLAQYRQEAEQHRTRAVQLESLRDLPAITADNVRVELMGNIEFPHEVAHCLERGSDGIGLYRTEFLYLGAEIEPTEEVHYEAYANVLKAMQGRPVVIRTLDLGADKLLGEHEGEERNPFLGLRSIRLSLKSLPLFRTQLRAILRSSVLGDARLMFPLITTLQELRQAKAVLTGVMDDLSKHDIAFNREIPIGMMVEVPAAVIMAEHFAKEVAFLSIGTNDLIQYTLAVDRGNTEVAGLYNAADPAVLKLIDLAIKAADGASIPVNVCGQMSGSTTYTMLLLGLGLRRFSVAPSAIPEVKKVCRGVTIPQCQAVARKAMGMENARDIKRYLREELKKVLPEYAA